MDVCSLPGCQDEATEERRLAELSCYELTQDRSDPNLDLLTELAAKFLGADIGGISIVYQSQIWLPSRVGVSALRVPRAGSLCTWAVASDSDWFEVPDALRDPRFKDNPLVAQPPHYRHYAAATLKGAHGYILGTFWMMWREPGECSAEKKMMLMGLAQLVMETLEMRYCNDVTGMSNRKAFLHHLQLGLERNPHPHVIVGYVDLIGFRHFNDVFGREAGNDVLRLTGERLSAWAGQSNLVAHLGGDKFAFALFGEHQAQSDCIERLTNELSAPFTLTRGGTQVLHARIGVEHHDLPYQGAAATLLDAAETAASSISAAHMRTSVKEYGFELLAKSRLVYELQGALAGDIRHGTLLAYYQPQVNYEEGRLIGMEALVRWQHPSRGLVPPGSFIAVAESTDKIYQVDLQVLEQVCRDMRKWLDAGLPDLPVSLNFSRRSLLHPDIVGDLQRLLALYGIPGRLLEFEVTESLLVETPELLSPRVAEFRAMGIRIAIDDFGTGYSNLDAVNSFQFDRLKVDRQFVHGVASNKRVAGLFRLIKGIAEVFDVELVCEGLELEEDRAWLAERGSHCVQGWYFSPARTPADMAGILAAIKARGEGAPPLSLDELRALFRPA